MNARNITFLEEVKNELDILPRMKILSLFIMLVKQSLLWMSCSKTFAYRWRAFGLQSVTRAGGVSKRTIGAAPALLLTRSLFPYRFGLFSLLSTRLYASTAPAASNISATGTATATVTEECKPKAPIEYFRSDYRPVPYRINKIYLDFQLHDSETIVTGTSSMISDQLNYSEDLVLDGEELELLEVSINEAKLTADQFKVQDDKLIISATTLKALGEQSKEFQLQTKVKIRPDKNSALSGLYKSGSILCTQCEAMGFRRITYYLDRPDVLSVYEVRLEGDKTQYPILLSNGNNIASGDILGTNRHFAVWKDPFPKPSYLFALVAGDLASIHDTFKTTSGRTVQLGIYSDKENSDKLDHAMYSLIESMKWDEETFGLECDVDIYNVVATNEFNMGAMENKGLNIFNSMYVLADPKTATDVDYERILGVIGHEYFHNWSGNRVTVRDWFQLTLKEGLTVFRDQWFTSDKTSRAVKRIEDVKGLRGRQFAEDASPMAHPIRPESYISMDNFYTATVYQKGAEVIGIYKTLLGEEGFKKGLKLYFDRHDGTAVTCDDFRHAMADANGVDLSQMDRWYSQAGTPIVTVKQQYNPETKVFSVTVSQRIPTTPGPNQREEDKKPMVIPLTTGLLDSVTGQEIVPSQVLVLKEQTQTFEFPNIPNPPVLSILRDFSAPVKLDFDQTDDELLTLMTYDTDSFNCWEASHRYWTKYVLQLASLLAEERKQAQLPEKFLQALRHLLATGKAHAKDKSLIAYALQIPDEATLINVVSGEIPLDGLYEARNYLKQYIAKELAADFKEVYESLSSSAEYQFTPAEVGRRRLRNICLDYLAALYDPTASTTDGKNAEILQLIKDQYDHANCMTDRIAALVQLASIPSAARTEALTRFYEEANGNALVINKWFSIQAMADYEGLVKDVKQLKQHPAFSMTNPNRARSLLTIFGSNLRHFHQVSGEGYRFLADAILELDRINPQVAARMMTPFGLWRRFDAHRQRLMNQELERIQQTENLSPDTYEIVSRYLK